MPATRCRAAWRVPLSQPWLESPSSALASWWSSIFAPPIASLAHLRLAPLAIGNDAHHFVNNVRSNPNFPNLVAMASWSPVRGRAPLPPPPERRLAGEGFGAALPPFLHCST